ncbi:bifunctional folylpolyglutamate synthase/dihydrofolate synthase [Tenuifilum sp.]|uniref:bifunctional folylpolyglutamate synthase/dihydrofolate synthase n=1 Tax=Tenuifilum sp. TaxID=2760880 RepID=UPI001B6C2E97|nr:bifunctional folylpolyglutamate synthase/dihydrofolate synthase [Bacteroidales bacterium]HOK61203.1 folylpolyglutamate synthase/dihydrofolate synthase family protein [Tenuifilum sp.]HOK86784.1 folylpolyglutamate synthase/dihydrofolate synthase family protein [Tenuifilum sp.]HON70318.1 folylpolyglutamate synthase/dihydrofolate synthase family protein [Tenuifilum sp.]HOU73684.1 folylpolyglutamate synthase/dihydrofolate synthase family protein [Tenuifilum sp.]
MTYNEALDYIYSHLPIFQRVGKAAYKADLGNTLKLDEYFGHPHRTFKTIHIAGTNGKGSTSHMLAAVLQKAGYRVGLYTSPHLRDFRERIRVNGEMIPEDEVAKFISQHKDFFDQIMPSFFEMTVALAFDYFSRMNLDVAVIEVGLGGRLDSTNIINPILSVITNIGFDHTDLLGDTLPKIASEKAGIIKPDTPVVVSKYQPEVENVFIAKAKEMNAPIYFADQEIQVYEQYIDTTGLQVLKLADKVRDIKIEIDLLGNYQRYNISGVLKSIEILSGKGFLLSNEALMEGLRNVQTLTGLMGRWQKLSENPLIYCDTGHNVDGIKYVVEQLRHIPHNNLHMVIGVVADKNIDGMLALLPKNATYYFTQAAIPRALNHEELKKRAAEHQLYGHSYSTVALALAAAKEASNPNDLIFVGGSTFVVAEVV